MQSHKLYTTILAAGLVTALSGCLQSGGGGGGGFGGGGGGGGSDYEAAFDAASGRAPTSDMPTRIQAEYEGQFKVGVNGGSADLLGSQIDPQMAEIVGDLEIGVDWTDGQTANPFTGKADNITVTEAGTSNSVVLDGELTVDASLPASLTRTVIPAQVVGGQSIPEVQTGAMLLHMTGQLSHDGQRGDVTAQLGGNFVGPQGEGMIGAVVGGIKDVDDPTAQIFDAGFGGTFYLLKK
ncbi:hypothetical protein [Tropicibacter oceani]|uniref:Transferrin-binding protein B C-lobe/N-lobe beta barrel domain-containing protein n=1 Tax=Tropicibacter oceani TaxID=3058420 RepID=A0ABY8QEI6_9RHOB|nr:hypothetical protein [Tropicibacter oceani]WGW02919.1 hypothetical protein QF118_13350 [Tropicibacter oceani]